MLTIILVFSFIFTVFPSLAYADDAISAIEEKFEELVAEQIKSFYKNPKFLEGLEVCSQPFYQELFQKASDETGFPKDKLAEIAVLESGCNPNARSRVGASGLMQFMPTTGADYGLVEFKYRKTAIIGRDGKKKFVFKKVIVRDDRTNPELSVMAAARHLAELTERLGNIELAVMAYHGGEGLVNKFIAMARKTPEMNVGEITPIKMFFYNAQKNRELFRAIKKYLTPKHDWFPSYPFRVVCAGRLFRQYVDGILDRESMSCSKKEEEKTPEAFNE